MASSEAKTGLGKALMLAGFITVIAQLLLVFLQLIPDQYILGLGVSGFLAFLLGVELYMRNRESRN